MQLTFLSCPIVVFLAWGLARAPLPALAQTPPPAAKARTFDFTYATTITNLPPGKTARIWVPLPPATVDQDVALEKETLPAKGIIATEPLYGNKMLYLEATPDKDGNIALSLTFKVTRHEVKTGIAFRKPGAQEKIARFLEADKLVPITGKPLELLKDVKLDKDQYKLARTLYDLVDRHMKYSKTGQGWGRGDAVWACASKFGNCSDFHSVFIALARSQRMPAKFEMGFPLPAKRGAGSIGGYHCWAWFLPDGKGWVPVDISEANQFPERRDYCFGNLSEDRIQFTTGRDIDLVPRQAGPALNYFIYPYVELDGQPLPAAQIKSNFSYRDRE